MELQINFKFVFSDNLVLSSLWEKRTENSIAETSNEKCLVGNQFINGITQLEVQDINENLCDVSVNR